jgi:hypothetical protein
MRLSISMKIQEAPPGSVLAKRKLTLTIEIG